MRCLNILGILAAVFSTCSAESTIVNLKAAAIEQFRPLSLIGLSTEAKAASSGPASLEAYCAQANALDEINEGRRWASYVVGQPVKADWLEFGVYYDGWIIGINKDGTYNVHYEMDDMIERGVKVAHLKPRKVGPKNLNPKHDPACELKDDVKKLNEEIDQANEDIARWSSERSAKRGAHGGETPSDGAATDAVDQRGSSESPPVFDKPNRTHVDSYGNRRGPRFSPTSTSPTEDWKQSETRLKEVLDGIQKVDDEVDKIAEKKVDLDKKGNMDAELGAAIDAAVEFQNRVKDKAIALKKAVTAAAAAGTAAAAAASQQAKEKAQATVDAADAKVEDTLHELQSDFHQVRQNAQKFNKEVAPNSVKWWRFRYEYSYMEAMIMLAVVPIMVLYKYIYGCVRGHSRGMVKQKWFAGLLRDIQSMHLAWLQFAAGEMFVCFMVAITVWLMFTFRMFDWLVLHVHDDNVHIPTTPEHYQLLAMNICMQLGLALLAYHMLVYNVVTATVLKFDAWDAYENEKPTLESPAIRSTKSLLQRSTTIMGGPFEFSQMKDYWMEIVEKYPHFKEKLETIQPLDKHFPFGEYLSVNVRLQTDDILQFTWQFWLCAWFTFGIFTLLHRFAHMAYVRIMLFFSFVLLLVLLGMVYVVRATTKRMMEGDDGDKEAHELERQHFTHWISLLLQFVVFFLCYGFTRMVTAPWLWHIYFYNVLWLTVIFGAVMVAFVLYLAPLIPAFYAAMSIPPNITEEEVDRIVHSMHQHHHHLHSPDGSPGSKQAHAQSFDSG